MSGGIGSGTFTPPVQPQLTGAPSQSDDCGPQTVRWNVLFASDGKVRPRSPADVRQRMTAAATGGTTIEQVKRGIESYAPEFAAVGLEPPVFRIRSLDGSNSVIRPVAELEAALAKGQAAGVFERYSVINAKRPALSGDKRFMKTHILPLLGNEDEATVRFDPLYDRRRKGIPGGPRRISLAIEREALSKVPRSKTDPKPIGPGKAVFGTIAKAKAIPVVPAPPQPPTYTEAQYLALQGERDMAQVALGLIDDLAVGIGWQRLSDMAQAGLPAGDSKAPVNDGGTPE